jgi:hypothetical protein
MDTEEEVKQYLKMAFWDSTVDAELLYNILHNKSTTVEGITIDKIYLRLLESYSWYTILDIITLERVNEILSEKIVSKIWNKALRMRYEYARKLLSTEALPLAR